LTPESSAASVRPSQTQSRVISDSRRRHNPNVARYLGLGSTTEPNHLARYAPRSGIPDNPPDESGRKRPRLRIREPPSKPVASTPTLASCNTQSLQVAEGSDSRTEITDDHTMPQSVFVHPGEPSYVTPRKPLGLETVRINDQNAVKAPHADAFHIPLFDLGADNIHGVSPDTDGEVLCQDNNDISTSDDNYDFDSTSDELLILTSESNKPCLDRPFNDSKSPAESDHNNNDRRQPSDDYSENAPEEAPPVNTSQHIRKKFMSPLTLTTHLLAVTGDGGSANTRKPIVRHPFPKPVHDRSPIIGLSSNVVLRTCFRIGEAINQSHQGSRSGQQMIIELYARVLTSERTETQQYFTFCDLFHTRPPYIKGAYDAVIWRAVPLFEYDSWRLLQQGRMCRCIGTMKRNGKEWIMNIHNIWEATWEDIEWVEGIVNS
jgi:hypothetical protein